MVLTKPSVVLPVHKEDQEEFFVCVTLIMELLWKIRNKVWLNRQPFSLSKALTSLNFRI